MAVVVPNTLACCIAAHVFGSVFGTIIVCCWRGDSVQKRYHLTSTVITNVRVT